MWVAEKAKKISFGSYAEDGYNLLESPFFRLFNSSKNDEADRSEFGV